MHRREGAKKSVIYLDNSATTRVCPDAVAAMRVGLETHFFNPSAAYAPALAVEKEVDAARASVAGLLGTKAAHICFTSGGTEANHLAIQGALIGQEIGQIVTAKTEHPSVLEVYARLEKCGWRAVYLDVDPYGQVSIEALEAAVDEQTRLVSLHHVNNEIGAVQDVAEAARRVKKKNKRCMVHVDGVQALARVPVRLMETEIDCYSVSAHKIHGPKGVGALAIREDVRLSPLFVGGGQEGGLRAGTENVPGIVGFGAACRWYSDDWREKMDYLGELKQHLVMRLATSVSDIAWNGPSPEQGAPHILNVSIVGVKAETMLHALEGEGILVSTGSACAAKKHQQSHVIAALTGEEARRESAIRLSLCPYNTIKEMDKTADEIARLALQLRRFKRR